MAKITIDDGEVMDEERQDAETGQEEEIAVEAGEEETETKDGEEEQSAPALVVQIGDEEPEEDETAKAPQWVRDLRKRAKDLERENRELKAAKGGDEEPAKLGPKPTRADCDYDDEEYDRRLETWYEQKRTVEAEAQKAEDQRKAQEQAWAAKLTKYAEAKTALGVKDYDDAEAFITDTFSVTQQGVIVQGAENPALVGYALAKNPKRAADLAKISDPIEFAFAIAKLESQLKVTNRNTPPPPEKRVTGSTGASTSADATLEKLREEAARTGDYSKVTRYKRERRGS